jgi:hypothetical protein
MSEDTCAALSAAFPIVLFTIIFNGRATRKKYRRGALYKYTLSFGIIAGVTGLFASAIGVQTSGLGAGTATITWESFGVSMVSLVIIILLLGNTYDIKDQNPLGRVGEALDKLAQLRLG